MCPYAEIVTYSVVRLTSRAYTMYKFKSKRGGTEPQENVSARYMCKHIHSKTKTVVWNIYNYMYFNKMFIKSGTCTTIKPYGKSNGLQQVFKLKWPDEANTKEVILH